MFDVNIFALVIFCNMLVFYFVELLPPLHPHPLPKPTKLEDIYCQLYMIAYLAYS